MNPLESIIRGMDQKLGPIPGAKLHFTFTDSPGLTSYEGHLVATTPEGLFSETVTISLGEAAEFMLMKNAEGKISFMRGKFQEAYLKLKAQVEESRKERCNASV